MSATAKLFMTGSSQAVRIPKEFRFQGQEVFISRNALTSEVVLSPKPNSWAEFFEIADRANIPLDFMTSREDISSTK